MSDPRSPDDDRSPEPRDPGREDLEDAETSRTAPTDSSGAGEGAGAPQHEEAQDATEGSDTAQVTDLEHVAGAGAGPGAGAGAGAGAPGADGPQEDAGEDKARKLRREEAREAAEAERAAREQQAYEEALELARADAERMLAGPGLVTPDQPIPPVDLEAAWCARALSALHDVRRDLRGHRVGLAISGGGALGSFEAGALRFLYDHVGIDPVAICGNSAGALNAAKLAEGPHTDRRPIDEVERIWRSLRINSDMWEPEPWLVRLQASASWAAELREQVADAEGATSAVRVAVRVVGSLVRRPPETDGTIDAVKEAIRAKSLLSLSPVAELVERELDPERIKASGIALRMGTVSLEAGELRYVTEDGELHDRHDRPIGQPAVALARGVLASASIPMAFPPVPMNDEHYIDGGAREILPLEVLAHQIGAERVIAISASSASIKRAPSFADRNLIDILRRVSAEIGPNETLRKELNPPGGWDPHVRLIVPQFDVHDSMTIDPALIAISLDHGYMRAADVVLSLGDEAAELTEQITRLRISLRHLAGPIPTFFDTALGRDRRDRLEGRVTEGRSDEADPDVIDVDLADGDEEADEHRNGESVVRAARHRTATTVAKLVKVIGRDSADRDGEVDGDEHLAREDAAAGSRVAGEVGHEDAIEVDVEVTHLAGEGGSPVADVEIRNTEGAVEVVLVPRPDERPAAAPGQDELDVEVHAAADGEVGASSAVPDLEADQGPDAEADEARRADIARITEELRDLVQRRADLGLPLPQTLVAWLREPAAKEVQDDLHPVGGSALGGV